MPGRPFARPFPVCGHAPEGQAGRHARLFSVSVSNAAEIGQLAGAEASRGLGEPAADGGAEGERGSQAALFGCQSLVVGDALEGRARSPFVPACSRTSRTSLILGSPPEPTSFLPAQPGSGFGFPCRANCGCVERQCFGALAVPWCWPPPVATCGGEGQERRGSHWSRCGYCAIGIGEGRAGCRALRRWRSGHPVATRPRPPADLHPLPVQPPC